MKRKPRRQRPNQKARRRSAGTKTQYIRRANANLAARRAVDMDHYFAEQLRKL